MYRFSFRIISIVLAAVLLALTACDDNTGNLGYDIVPSNDLVDTNFKTFDVTTSSYRVGDKVLARSSMSYLGRFTDPETGTIINSDFLMQLYCPETFAFPTTVTDDKITSVDLRLYVSDFIGDSLATFKLNVYELDKVIDAGQDYYTDINPADYYDETSQPIATKWFSLSDRTISDSLRYSSSYSRSIRISLPAELGQQIYDAYKSQPSLFKNTDSWLNSGLPCSKGFYFQLESGDGAIAYIDVAQMNFNFKYYDTEYKKDTTGLVQMACTEEVVQATRFQNSNLDVLLDNTDATYIKSPAGIFTQATLPVDQINITDTINSAKLVFTRYNDKVDSKFKLSIPKTVLLVRLDDYLNGFFEKYSLADAKSSYLTTFTASSNTYEFSNISKLLNIMKAEKKAGKATENYNKVLIIPVQATYDSNNVLVRLSHDFSMSSAKLVGGSDKIKLELIYSSYK